MSASSALTASANRSVRASQLTRRGSWASSHISSRPPPHTLLPWETTSQTPRQGAESSNLRSRIMIRPGMVSGVVEASLSIDWLNSEIARNVLPPKATISVVDRHRTILARWPNHEKFVGTRITPSSHTTLLTGGEGFNEATGFDGIV